MTARDDDAVTATQDLAVGLDDGSDVAVMRNRDGSVFLAPRSIRDASPGAQRAAADLQATVRALGRGRLQLEDQVAVARAAGMSWAAIGWCTGLTGEGVRQRFAE